MAKIYTYELQVFEEKTSQVAGCTTFTTSTSPRSIERRRDDDATQRDAFPRSRRGSLCNTFTMQLHQRRLCPIRTSVCESECIPVHVQTRTNRVNTSRTNALAHAYASAADRHTSARLLIIPVIIINCSDPRHADEIASQERAVKYGSSSGPGD